jgi:hypothetical protein
MDNNIPTAEEFYSQNMAIHKEESLIKGVYNTMIEFTKLHVEAALKAASKNAVAEQDFVDMVGEFEDIPLYKPYVVKDSILNAYPLTNIK